MAKRAKMLRRALFRLFPAGIALLGPGAALYIHYLNRQDKRDKRTKELLSWLFGRRDTTWPIAVVPALDHPNFKGHCAFSPSGEEVGTKYAWALNGLADMKNPEGRRLDPADTDSVVVIGSRFANRLSARYLGPATGNPSAGWTIEHPERLWRTKPHWIFSSPGGMTGQMVKQRGKPWFSTDHVIFDRQGTPYRSEKREADFLLITALPRYDCQAGRTQRVVVFEGLHRPGTLLAGSLMETADYGLLDRIRSQIKNRAFFQALFRTNTLKEDGELRPGAPELIQAHPLEIL